MGHANLENISDFFLQMLGDDGTALVSISDCVKALNEAGETVHASEGDYNDDSMLGEAVEQVIEHLLNYEDGPVIQPYRMSKEQEKVYRKWETAGQQNEEWSEEEYEIFDGIEWTLEDSWRSRYNEVVPLKEVEN